MDALSHLFPCLMLSYPLDLSIQGCCCSGQVDRTTWPFLGHSVYVEDRCFPLSAWFPPLLLRGWRFYFVLYPSCGPRHPWSRSVLPCGGWTLILANCFLLSFLCTLMRTLGTVHAICQAFLTPTTALQGHLAGDGPQRKCLGLEVGAHLIPSGLRL